MASKVIKGLTVMVDGDATGLTKAIRQSTTEMNAMKSAVNNVNAALKLDPKNTELLADKQKLLKKAIDESSSSLEKLKDMQKQLDQQGEEVKLTKEYTELQKKIAETEDTIKRFKNQLTTLSPSMQVLTQNLKEAGKSFDELSDKTKLLSTAAAGALAASVKSFMGYESGIADIKKVISDLSDETVADLKEVAKQTATTSAAFGEISEYATIAATLGVAEKDIASFSETMKDLAVATNNAISGEEGAKSVARLLNVFDIGADKAGNLGSTLTYVGDQFAATADEILNMTSRMSGLSVINNLTQTDLIGLAAELKNIGVETESGASAITKSFLTIEREVATGGELLETFASTAGMSAKQFTEAWGEKPMETFLAFTDGLKSQVFTEISAAVDSSSKHVKDFADVLEMSADQFKKAWAEDPWKVFDQYTNALGEMSEESESASVILDEVKLSGVRVAQTLLKVAGNGDVVKNAIADANEEWERNTALSEKASKVYETSTSKMYSSLESLKQAGANLGEAVMPVFEEAVEKIGDFSDFVSTLSPQTMKLIAGVLGFTAALSPTTKAISKTTSALGKVIESYDNFKKKANDAAGSSNILISALGKISPAALGVTSAVGALAAAVALFYAYAKENAPENLKLIESLKDQQEALQTLTETAEAAYAQELANINIGGQYAKTIDTLAESLESGKLSEEEYTASKENLISRIGMLNDIIGEAAFAYDEESGNLLYLGEEVETVTGKYEELHDEMKKNAWLEANKDSYIEATRVYSETQETMRTAFENFTETANGASETAMELFEKVINGQIEAEELVGTLSALSMDDQITLSQLVDGYTHLGTVAQENQTLMEQAQSTISEYDAILGSSTEESSRLIDLLNAGVDLSASKEELEEMKTKLQNNLDLAILFSDQDWISEDTIERIKQDLDLVNEQIAGTTDAMNEGNRSSLEETTSSIQTKAEELMTGITDTTFNAANESATEISTAIKEMYGVTIPPAMIDPTKTALENIRAYWAALKLPEKEVIVRVKYIEENGSYGAGGTQTYSSGNSSRSSSVSPSDFLPYSVAAFSLAAEPVDTGIATAAYASNALIDTQTESNVDNTLEAIATTLSNANKAKESISNTTTNNFKVEFNITNATKTDREDYMKYADEFCRYVNEKLGRMIG